MSNEKTELTEDDNALFEVVAYLMDKLAETKDARIADIANFAMEQCRKDPQVVAKLLVQLGQVMKQQQQPIEPYNPFATQRQRR